MKTRGMIFCVVAMICISGSLVRSQDNVPQPPGYGGKRGEMGMADPMPPGMPIDMINRGIQPEEFPEDVVARCLLKVSCDPSILSLDYRMMKHLWLSTGVLNKAYRDVLNDPNSSECWGYIFLINDAGAPVDTMYSVAIPRDYGKEKEILAAAVGNLKSTLSKMVDQEQEKLRKQFIQTNERCQDMENQVADMQAEVRGITQEGITNCQEIQKKIGDVLDRLRDTEMNIQYSDNRIGEFRRQKEELQVMIERAVAADTVTEELKGIVKGAEESAALIEQLYKEGRTPADKIQEAKERLARAKIELAKRVDEVRANAGQGQLVDIDNKIASAASQISEFKLRNDFMLSEYARTRELLAKCDKLVLLEMKLDAAKRSFQDVLKLRENLSTQLSMLQPLSVSVIGMD
jgi:hypothetical protein